MNGTAQTHAEAARRVEAFTILENIEELIWAATKRNETVPQTRLYYEKVLCGYDPDTPKPLYDEAGWDDGPPPPLEIGQDPRICGRREFSVKVEMEDVIQENGDSASHEKRSSSDDGGVRIKVEEELEQDGEDHDISVERTRDDAAAGDKRKRVGRAGQSPGMSGL